MTRSAKVTINSDHDTLIPVGRFINRDTSRVAPLVSVVIPVFNGMPHLPALTESVLNQSYQALEIIFSEGGGSDGSLTFLNSLNDPRIRIIQQPAGTSAADNWTAATQAANGDYIKLVCQDDLLYSTAIAGQVHDLETHPTATMAIAQRDVIDANGDRFYANRGCAGLDNGLHSGDEVLKATFLQGMNVLGEPLAVLFKADALKSVMPWDGSNPLVLDLDCYERVSRAGDVLVRREAIGAFRVSTSSWSTRLAKEQLRQFQDWQVAFAGTNRVSLSKVERARAGMGVYLQTGLRRGAYTWLRMKGSFRSKA